MFCVVMGLFLCARACIPLGPVPLKFGIQPLHTAPWAGGESPQRPTLCLPQPTVQETCILPFSATTFAVSANVLRTMSFQKFSVGFLLIGKGFMFAVVSLTFDLRWTALTAALHTCLHPLTRAGEGNAS